jgi:hypothetical protein
MARLAIHQVNLIVPSQVEVMVQEYIANQSAIILPPRLTSRFPAFKINAVALADFNSLYTQTEYQLAYVARFALHQLTMASIEQTVQMISEYIASFIQPNPD